MAAREALHVEAERAPKARAAEVAEACAVAQQRLVLLQRQSQQGLVLADGQQQRMKRAGALQRIERAREAGPGVGHGVDAGAQEQVAAIEQQPRVDVPGQADERAVDFVGAPDALEVVRRSMLRSASSHGRSGKSALSAANSAIQVLPSCATSGVASPANAVSSFSWAALHGSCSTRTVNPGRSRCEIGEQFAHHLAFASHGPEAQRAFVAAAATSQRQRARAGDASQQPAARPVADRHGRDGAAARHQSSSSQPPVKPARCSPRRNCTHLVIACHTEPLVKLAIIARIGPWSMPR